MYLTFKRNQNGYLSRSFGTKIRSTRLLRMIFFFRPSKTSNRIPPQQQPPAQQNPAPQIQVVAAAGGEGAAVLAAGGDTVDAAAPPQEEQQEEQKIFAQSHHPRLIKGNYPRTRASDSKRLPAFIHSIFLVNYSRFMFNIWFID